MAENKSPSGLTVDETVEWWKDRLDLAKFPLVSEAIDDIAFLGAEIERLRAALRDSLDFIHRISTCGTCQCTLHFEMNPHCVGCAITDTPVTDGEYCSVLQIAREALGETS